VLPLSAAPHFKSTMIGALSDFAMHVLVLGPAIALVVRHFEPPTNTLPTQPSP